MTWLAVAKLFLSIVSSIMDQLRNKQLMDAGVAKQKATSLSKVVAQVEINNEIKQDLREYTASNPIPTNTYVYPTWYSNFVQWRNIKRSNRKPLSNRLPYRD